MTTERYFDLSADERVRLAHAIEACGDSWDPVSMLEGEAIAHRMLYSDLDDEQRAVYDMLRDTGVM